MERLVELFKASSDEHSWVRVPVIQYLMVCPLPKAKTYVAELEKIDPEAIRRASFIVPSGRPKLPAPEAAGGGGAKAPAKAAGPEKPGRAPANDDGQAAAPAPAPAGESLVSNSAPAADTPSGDDSPPKPAGGARGSNTGRRLRWAAAAGLLGVYLVFLRRQFRKKHATS
jgi:hypothetical protein